MKTLTFKNHFVVIEPDGEVMFQTISEHQIVTETMLQVHTEWPLSKSKSKGFRVENVDIIIKKHV